MDVEQLICRMFVAYPETWTWRNIEDSVRAYARGLDNVDIRFLAIAIDRIVKTSERPPTIAELLTTSLKLQYAPAWVGRTFDVLDLSGDTPS